MEEQPQQSQRSSSGGHFRYLKKEIFSSASTSLQTKQECIERTFNATRRKLHPLIRMDDLTDSRKSSSLKYVVADMGNQVLRNNNQQEGRNKLGMWYNIAVGLDRERHISTEANWQDMLAKVRTAIDRQAQKLEGNMDKLRWKVDLFPASDKFIVDHVINESSQFRKPRNLFADTSEGMETAALLGINSNRKQRAPMHHEPIYHMYIECTLKNFVGTRGEEDEDEVEHMDTMYSRWAVQNPLLLRQRILERMGTEVLVKAAASSQQRN